jgi:tryptophanyl-tRNA synthetase
VPEIHELSVYYLNLVSLARALRNPTVKSELDQKRNRSSVSPAFADTRNIPIGFLVYPIHQAADITAFDADVVPVGEDQLPMVEQTREIARKVNTLYGRNTVVVPQALLSDTPRLPGTDGGSKMSKSMANCIYLKSDPEAVERAVMKMFTDPGRIRADMPGRVEGNPVFSYHDAFNPNREEVSELKERYRCGTVGDVEVKTRLARVINKVLEPIRDRRSYFVSRMPEVERMLLDHTSEARHTTKRVLNRVREAMALRPLGA